MTQRHNPSNSSSLLNGAAQYFLPHSSTHQSGWHKSLSTEYRDALIRVVRDNHESGASIRKIAAYWNIPHGTVGTWLSSVTDPLGGIDPYRRGESPEQRAFRRYPIVAHKPGGWS